MTAAELIAFLATVPAHTQVVVSGYEGGLTAHVAAPRLARIRDSAGIDPYSGEFDEAGDGEKWLIWAVLIERDQG